MSEEQMDYVLEPKGQSFYKTYFHVNKIESKFPIDFAQSKNDKYIQVKWCKAIYEGELVGDIMVHASFVQRDGYLDNFICFTNTGESQKYIAKYQLPIPVNHKNILLSINMLVQIRISKYGLLT